jgi:hypothetical protein
MGTARFCPCLKPKVILNEEVLEKLIWFKV